MYSYKGMKKSRKGRILFLGKFIFTNGLLIWNSGDILLLYSGKSRMCGVEID